MAVFDCVWANRYQWLYPDGLQSRPHIGLHGLLSVGEISPIRALHVYTIVKGLQQRHGLYAVDGMLLHFAHFSFLPSCMECGRGIMMSILSVRLSV